MITRWCVADDGCRLACTVEGPADGPAGLRQNVAFLAAHREKVGPDFPLMVDCYMSLDIPYAIDLAEAARPLGVYWLEEALHPDDFAGHRTLKQACPWMRWTTGEHEYTRYGFRNLVEDRLRLLAVDQRRDGERTRRREREWIRAETDEKDSLLLRRAQVDRQCERTAPPLFGDRPLHAWILNGVGAAEEVAHRGAHRAQRAKQQGGGGAHAAIPREATHQAATNRLSNAIGNNSFQLSHSA